MIFVTHKYVRASTACYGDTRKHTYGLPRPVKDIALLYIYMMKKALSSSETSVLTRAARRNIPEDTILHSHCRENFKSYKVQLQFILSVISYITDSCEEAIWPTPRRGVHSIGVREKVTGAHKVASAGDRRIRSGRCNQRSSMRGPRYVTQREKHVLQEVSRLR
jgi:hypothetical protein